MIEFVKAVKSDHPERLFVTSIIGWDPSPDARYQVGMVQKSTPAPRTELDNVPICQSGHGSATAGIRLKAFTDAFGENGRVFSICADDFGPALQGLGAAVAAKMK
jgi:hypothetical protein